MAFGQRQEMSSEKLRQQYEGQLHKYTNVMKGWQYRWFVLDPETGVLNYFLSDSEHKHRPRGSVHLAGAVISPSDEDSNTFTVNSATGEMFKLRAVDARARQEWVNRLRSVAEMHTLVIAQSNPPLLPREHHSIGSSVAPHSPATIAPKVHCSMAVLDAFSTVREHLNRAENSQLCLVRSIEELPGSGTCTRHLDESMLLLKATSHATLLCLGQCLSILQQQQISPPPAAAAAVAAAAAAVSVSTSINQKIPARQSHLHENEIKKSLQREFSETWSEPNPSTSPTSHLMVSQTTKDLETTNFQESIEITDEEELSDSDTVPLEENKSVILHLLSQLKLGMDLTRVVLPTFILERRSLLEMFADSMGHPDFFIRITDEPTAQGRMLALLEWYLTSFHVGRQSTIAKKPYNPIIGETFHCSWRVPIEKSKSNSFINLYYTSEQVSHHPPITAFYIECPEKKICLNASIWTKSNFSGMSVGVSMIGDITLYLGEHKERYDFTLPAAYARSILSVPWVELGGKVSINCPNTGYLTNIIFHTKPFYGGKVNLVSADVKNDVGISICKVNGEWNTHYQFNYASGTSKIIKLSNINIIKKRVRRVEDQGNFESRKLWYNVTQTLKIGDIEAATEFKRSLEEDQRIAEKRRLEEGTSFPTKYFHKEEDSWIYNKLLCKL